MRRAGIVAILAACAAAAACANILSYDDYTARATRPDASIPDTKIAQEDTAVEATTEVPVGEVPLKPPSRPPGVAEASGKGKSLYLMVRRFFLNTRDFDEQKKPGMWKELGYDLDGICTGEKESRENTGTCIKPEGAGQDVLIDGIGCRDNNFGSQVIPMVALYNADFEKEGNDAIDRGFNSWILVIDDLDDGPTDTYAPGRLYKAAHFAGAPTSLPKFDGTDQREAAAESVVDNDINKPRTRFPKAYVRDNVWVSGEPFDFEIIVPINAISLTMPIIKGVATLQLDPDHNGGSIGILGGALARKGLESVIAPVADAAGFCPGTPLYESILSRTAKMLDVVVEAPNLQSTTVTCNGISLGMGFKVAPILPVTLVRPTAGTTQRCAPDAGVDGG